MVEDARRGGARIGAQTAPGPRSALSGAIAEPHEWPLPLALRGAVVHARGMTTIDAHIHLAAGHPECDGLLERLDVKVLNVCVPRDSEGKWREEAERYRSLNASSPERFAWCTGFDLPRFGDPHYAERAIQGLRSDIDAGAVACKIWKNVGMEVRRPDGAFLMVDDPLFEPILAFLEKEGLTLLLHIGEPLACWQPLDPASPHYGYYSAHPEWHMHGRAGFPPHQALIDARDRVVERHRRLRVVGAHLGSLEHDVAEVARRFERYPNFAVDTSARVRDLAHQEPAKVRAFFDRFPDRVLFGTDQVYRTDLSQVDAAERSETLRKIEARYAMERAFYEGRGAVTLFHRQVEGLGLSEALLRRFCAENARRWYTGL